MTEKFLEDQKRLNLQKNDEGIYVCKGRMQGHYPVYLPPRVSLAEKIVQVAHPVAYTHLTLPTKLEV